MPINFTIRYHSAALLWKKRLMSNKQISDDVLSNLIFTHYRWDVNLYKNFGKLFFFKFIIYIL